MKLFAKLFPKKSPNIMLSLLLAIAIGYFLIEFLNKKEGFAADNDQDRDDKDESYMPSSMSDVETYDLIGGMLEGAKF